MDRIVFMGTPDFAVPALSALVEAGRIPVAVYSQPPRRAGRGMKERPSPIHALAESHGIEVRTPVSLRSPEEHENLKALAPDTIVVAAYGLILPAGVLAIPRNGCLNIHPSLLPRWRGAAPLQRTLMAGDARTGVCIMRMEQGLDTGPVCLREGFPVPGSMTAGELHDALAALGARLLVKALDELDGGGLACRPQSEEGVTYAEKIDKAEARIEWSRDAGRVHDHIRGLSPFPGAWFELGDGDGGKGERIKVLKSETVEASGPAGTTLDDHLAVACGTGAVRLLEVQRQGKGAMDAEAFLRGHPVPAGTLLG